MLADDRIERIEKDGQTQNHPAIQISAAVKYQSVKAQSLEITGRMYSYIFDAVVLSAVIESLKLKKGVTLKLESTPIRTANKLHFLQSVCIVGRYFVYPM